MTTFFLKHPVIAIVLNAILCVVGWLCFNNLSMREYPHVTFPKVYVWTYYPNASAEVVETSITNPLEDQLAGIEGLETITSESKTGSSRISLSFRNSVSMDRVLLSIREAISLAQLPKEIDPPYVERKSASDSMPFMIVSLEGEHTDFGALTHYARLNLKNTFRAVPGVASVEVWGQPYTYYISLDRRKMYAFGVNVDEVYAALSKANVSLPVGKFQDQIEVTLNSELKTENDYRNLIVKEKNPSAPKEYQELVRLYQIADVRLQTDNRRFRVRINGKPGLCLGIQKTNDANPLDVSEGIRKQLKILQQNSPKDIHLALIQDGGEFVRYSLKNVKSSILEAIFFVLVVVFLFLRNIKATFIPIITIPISLIGSCLFLSLFGFSINILTLLAMVLAIGLVVDDAIIVLENIQRYVEKGLSPSQAALKGSKEIAFAIIAMTLTLTSVYTPLAFMTGTVGRLFTEFAVALAGSVLISGVVALTLSPLMCAKALKQHSVPLWPKIDVFLSKLSQAYEKTLLVVLNHPKLCLLSFIICLIGVGGIVKILPSETAPKEDRSLIGVYLPPILGKDINTIDEKTKIIEDTLRQLPEADHTLVFMGHWGGNVVFPLKPQNKRRQSAQEIAGLIKPVIQKIPSLQSHVWNWDSGLPGSNDDFLKGGLSLVICSTDSYEAIFKTVDNIRKDLEAERFFKKVDHDLKLDTSSYSIDLDNSEMGNLGLNPQQVAKTIQVFFSGDQTLTFKKDGLLYNITLEGKESPWSLNELYVTNKSYKQISLAVIAKLSSNSGPQCLYHHNQMRSVTLNADLPDGGKIGDEMENFMSKVRKKLPEGYQATWVGAAKVYTESQSAVIILFLLAIGFIYAILAVQFENFLDPVLILVTVPLACFGALAFVWIFKGSLNIYTQIGLITLIGLISKHGILIVEFANQLGKNTPLKEAIVKACQLRLRPILMTTCAMIFGALPLVVSSDAGHEAQQAIGIVLVGGIAFGTLLTLFVVPTIFLFIKNFWGNTRMAEAL